MLTDSWTFHHFDVQLFNPFIPTKFVSISPYLTKQVPQLITEKPQAQNWSMTPHLKGNNL